MIAAVSGFIIFIGLLSYFQIRHILSKEGKKEVAAYCFLMALAAIVGSLLIAGVEIPRQSLFIKIFEPIGKAVLGK